jgi:hypothetical protein
MAARRSAQPLLGYEKPKGDDRKQCDNHKNIETTINLVKPRLLVETKSFKFRAQGIVQNQQRHITTTSMGRLTLNMLLSFAQFEREVTGERIRDKIAASKKKGLWMGGRVPLGYEVRDRKLVVNEAEAEQVRHIMRRYLDLGTVPALVVDLVRDNYRTKLQTRTSGPHRGGCEYRRGTLYGLLSNRIYRGMIVHKGTAYPGEHEAIVDEELWDAVQARLTKNAAGPSRRLRHRHPSLLAGKVLDGEGRQMSSTHTKKGSTRYRYYATRGDLLDGSRAWHVSAHDLEQLVCSEIARKFLEPQFRLSLIGAEVTPSQLQQVTLGADALASELRTGDVHAKANLLQEIIDQVHLHEDRIELTLSFLATCSRLGIPIEGQPTDNVTITIPAVRVRRGHQLRLIIPGAASQSPAPKRDDKLVTLVADALVARQLVLANPDRSLASIAQEHGRCRTRLGKLVALSCLAPDIVTAIVEGNQPEHLTATKLQALSLPIDWIEQRRQLGFS